MHRAAVRIGARSADLQPRVRPKRLPTLEPRLTVSRNPVLAALRRAGNGARVGRRPGPRLPGPAEDRDRQHRLGAGCLQSELRAARPCRDVLRDGGARGLVACDPPRRASPGPHPALGRDAGDVHRRADELDAAGSPRRAEPRPCRRPPQRPAAGQPADRAGDARLPDAAEHPRAGDPRRGDVLLGRHLQRPPGGAADHRDRAPDAAAPRADRAARVERQRSPRTLGSGARAAPPYPAIDDPGSRRTRRLPQPAPRRDRGWRAALRVGPAVAVLLPAARRARPRSTPGSVRRRRCCSR